MRGESEKAEKEDPGEVSRDFGTKAKEKRQGKVEIRSLGGIRRKKALTVMSSIRNATAAHQAQAKT